MADIVLTPTWEAGIYQLETTDPVIGGEDGISNYQAKLLGNRTEYLKQLSDEHTDSITNLETSGTYSTRAKGAASLVKQGVVTASIANGVFAFVSVAKITTSPVLNRITVTATPTSPVVLSFSAGYDANGPIVYYAYQNANEVINLGNNLSGILFAEFNPTTGALTWGAENTTIAPVVSYNDPGTTGYWFSLRDEKLYRWSGSAWVHVIRVLIGTFTWGGSGDFTMYLPVGRSVKSVCGRSDVPSGVVSAFAGATAPAGFLLCNGGAISRNIYSELFASIGTVYGTGDGSTTFNIPDLRGEFIRGFDGGRGIDVDTYTILATTTNGSPNISAADTTGITVGMAISGTGIPAGATVVSIASSSIFVISANATATGNFVSLTLSKTRDFGSAQADMFKLHTHKYARLSNAVNSGSPTTAAISDWEGVGNVQSTDNPQPVGGSESRPRNIAMNYIIKF